MRYLLWKALLLSIPFIILIGIINVYKDSGFAINISRSSEIAEILVSGKNAGISYIPQNGWGKLQSEIAEKRINKDLSFDKEILVFGTSRSSEISSSFFPKNSFFNCTIPGGNILDYIALYGLYKRHNFMPDYLFISIDPWTFHSLETLNIKGHNITFSDTSIPMSIHDKFLLSELEFGLKELGFSYISPKQKFNSDLWLKKVKVIFSFNYFQLNLTSFDNNKVIATKEDYLQDRFVIRKDGGYSLQRPEDIDSAKVNMEMQNYIAINKGNFSIPQDTSSIFFLYFTKLLLKLKSEGVIPIVYFAPINPIVYDSVCENSRMPLEIKINSFCSKNKILIVGSFNPYKYGFKSSDNLFMDAYHPVKSAVYNIFYLHKADLQKEGISITNSL